MLCGGIVCVYATNNILFVVWIYIRGIWPTGIGVVLTVLALLLCAGWNNTAYYPSNADLQSSLPFW